MKLESGDVPVNQNAKMPIKNVRAVPDAPLYIPYFTEVIQEGTPQQA